MTLSRDQFDRFVALLESEKWSVFPAVATADFDPLAEGADESRGWIWWSKWADQAFDDGVLSHPVLLRWYGLRWRLQLVLARAGLSGRLVSELNSFGEFPLIGTPGLLVLGPSSHEACDLSSLVQVFASLRVNRIIALPLAGLTPSEGRDDVASVRESPSQPSVFWDAQSHRFDDLGMIERAVSLEWGGNAEPIVEALREGGFEVDSPAPDERWLGLRSNRQAPDVPTVEQAEAFEKPLEEAVRLPGRSGPMTLVAHTQDFDSRREGAHQAGCAIRFLRWSPQGRIACALDHHASIFEPKLAELDPETFEHVHVHPTPVPSTYCSGLAWLPDGRRLSAWETGSKAHVFEDDDHEVLVFNLSRDGSGFIGVDAAGSLVAHPEGISFAVRQVGPPRTQPSEQTGTRVVRGNKTQDDAKPWSVVRRIYHDPGFAPWVYLSLGGEHLVLGSRKSFNVYSVSTGKVLWESSRALGKLSYADLNPAGSQRTRTRTIRFTYDSSVLFQTLSYALSEGDQYQYRTFAWDLETGHRPWPELEEALATASAVAPRPDGSLVVGTQDGEVRLLSSTGELVSELAVFPGKPTLNLAIGQDGLVAASNRFGQIATLRISD